VSKGSSIDKAQGALAAGWFSGFAAPAAAGKAKGAPKVGWLVLPHLLFVLLLLLIWAVPDRAGSISAAAGVAAAGAAAGAGAAAVGFDHLPFTGLLLVIEALMLVFRRRLSHADVTSIVLAFLLLWELFTVKLPGESNLLYPPPEEVLNVFLTGYPLILKGLLSSSAILSTAYALALLTAIPAGIALGLSTHVRPVLLTFIRIITPIPPLVYSPYAIMIMPSFWHASVFIVFMSIFWLVLLSMIYKVAGMERPIVEQVQTLNVGKRQFFLHVLIPYCLPHIFNVVSLSLTAAFTVLIVAEMFGGLSGIGWYPRYHANFAEYTKVVAGIVVVGVTVTVINVAIKLLRGLVIGWEKK
jgi:NitT/TauT family transport system permease protein